MYALDGGRGGRPRVPTALKKLRGTYRKDRANPNEPEIPIYEIPPASEGLPEIERGAWNDLRQMINPMRVATAVDMPAFEILVSSLTVARMAAESIRTKGIVSEGKLARPRPEAALLLSAQKNLWFGLSRFGATPADRSRVGALVDRVPRSAEDEFAD